MGAAREGALDRLSRDQEDVAALFKRLRFAGARIVTLAEGEVTELHVGPKGTINALFLKDLADKTRRGCVSSRSPSGNGRRRAWQGSGADRADRPKYWEGRRARHVLTVKVFCGTCGGPMSSTGRDYLGCGAAKRQGLCANARSVRRGAVEVAVLDGLRDRLMAPALVRAFVAGFAAEWNRQAAERSAERLNLVREFRSVERKRDGLIDAIADGLRASGLQARLDALEARHADLGGQLRAAPPTAPSMHPGMAESYRSRVADGGGEPVIELCGDLASMLRLAHGGAQSGDCGLFLSSVTVVTGRTTDVHTTRQSRFEGRTGSNTTAKAMAYLPNRQVPRSRAAEPWRRSKSRSARPTSSRLHTLLNGSVSLGASASQPCRTPSPRSMKNSALS
jgi:hypothetical protein